MSKLRAKIDERYQLEVHDSDQSAGQKVQEGGTLDGALCGLISRSVTVRTTILLGLASPNKSLGKEEQDTPEQRALGGKSNLPQEEEA